MAETMVEVLCRAALATRGPVERARMASKLQTLSARWMARRTLWEAASRPWWASVHVSLALGLCAKALEPGANPEALHAMHDQLGFHRVLWNPGMPTTRHVLSAGGALAEAVNLGVRWPVEPLRSVP